MIYKIYVKFYHHKMLCRVEAESAVEAKKLVAEKLQITKIVKDEPEQDDIMKNIMDMFGMKGNGG